VKGLHLTLLCVQSFDLMYEPLLRWYLLEYLTSIPLGLNFFALSMSSRFLCFVALCVLVESKDEFHTFVQLVIFYNMKDSDGNNTLTKREVNLRLTLMPEKKGGHEKDAKSMVSQVWLVHTKQRLSNSK